MILQQAIRSLSFLSLTPIFHVPRRNPPCGIKNPSINSPTVVGPICHDCHTAPIVLGQYVIIVTLHMIYMWELVEGDAKMTLESTITNQSKYQRVKDTSLVVSSFLQQVCLNYSREWKINLYQVSKDIRCAYACNKRYTTIQKMTNPRRHHVPVWKNWTVHDPNFNESSGGRRTLNFKIE